MPSLKIEPELDTAGSQRWAAPTRSILLAGNAMTMIGVFFFVPFLPLFLKTRGATPLLIGAVLAAGSLGRAAAQYPGGWLADRVGRRPVLVSSVLVYGLTFLFYLASVPAAVFIALRALHAFIGGLYQPAAAALLADLTPADERGAAYAQLRASDMVGILAGPVLGGLVAGLNLAYVFIGAAVLCLLGAAGLGLVPRAEPQASAEVAPLDLSLGMIRALLPAALLGSAIYYVFGTYDSIWSLYITSRGATPFLVGLSFATYAFPVVLLGGAAAWLVDRLGARRAGTVAVATYGLLNAAYPFIANVPALIGIGAAEGALTAAGQPALQAEVSRVAPHGHQGRAQGLYQTALASAQVGGSVAGGALYGVLPAFGFLGSTAVSLLMVIAAHGLWNRRPTEASS